MRDSNFDNLLRSVKACQFCRYHLHLPPKPIVQLNPAAQILVIAQAPGARASAAGRPFDDASGDRLRGWLGIDKDIFYDERKMAFMPMGFCYPGTSNTGDIPPCEDCAPIWHAQIMRHLPNIELTLLVGSYSHDFYLNEKSMNNVMQNWREYLPDILPLPHPSWHNNAWLKENPWFDTVLLPYLRKRIKAIVNNAIPSLVSSQS